MSDLVERLHDLHKQATEERSHYYLGKCTQEAADRIEALEAALITIERFIEEDLAAELSAKYGAHGTMEQIRKAVSAALAPEKDK